MQNKLLTLGVISLTALGLAGCSTQKQSSPKNNNQIKPTKVVKKKLSKKQQAKITKEAIESNKQAKKENKNQPDEQVRKSDNNQKTPATKKKGPMVDTSQQTQYTKKAQQQGPLADPSKAATTVVEHPHSNNSMQMEQKTSNRNPNTSTIYNDPTSYPNGQFR